MNGAKANKTISECVKSLSGIRLQNGAVIVTEANLAEAVALLAKGFNELQAVNAQLRATLKAAL